ncbi:UNVERIFIED_CONTAM: hypothetical protein NCL1_18330 [Trichonephila clavipes]
MAAPIQNPAKCEVCSVIRFLHAKACSKKYCLRLLKPYTVRSHWITGLWISSGIPQLPVNFFVMTKLTID